MQHILDSALQQFRNLISSNFYEVLVSFLSTIYSPYIKYYRIFMLARFKCLLLALIMGLYQNIPSEQCACPCGLGSGR